MEQSRIKNLFTVRCGLEESPINPKDLQFPKRGLLCWILPWHWIIIPLFRFLKKKKCEADYQAWWKKYNELHQSLHNEYNKYITNFIFDENKNWAEEDLKVIEKWAEEIDKQSSGALQKDLMLRIYKSKLMAKALEKTGYSVQEINAGVPSFVWGYDYAKGYISKLKDDKVASIVDFRFFFFTEKQLIIVNLRKDFFNNTERNTSEEFFYKHVAGIKVIEDVVINENTKDEIPAMFVVLNSSGDKSLFPIVTNNADDTVKCIKAALNNKLE